MKGAVIGRDCNIGDHAFIETGARIGNRVTLKNQAMVWDGVEIGDDVFVGPGVSFTNDVFPRSRRLPLPADATKAGWLVRTCVGSGASLGARCVVLPGAHIGAYAMVAAGAVVTREVPAHALMAGVPAKWVGWVCRCGAKLVEEHAIGWRCPRGGTCDEYWAKGVEVPQGPLIASASNDLGEQSPGPYLVFPASPTLANRASNARMNNLPNGSSGQRTHGLWRLLYLPQVYNSFTSVVGSESVMKLLAEQFVRPRPEDRILDVGCGTARILQYLPVARYVGIDNNSRYISAARQRYRNRGEFVVGNVGALSVNPSERFDIVLASGILHHIDDASAKSLLAASARLLAKDGRMVIADPVFAPGQSPVAKFLICLDRGRNVRTPEHYLTLAGTCFKKVHSQVCDLHPWLPYTQFVMECVV
ncbi:MAG: methyltransferase domain-containing protein [Stellaceae bacterium]